MAFCSQLCRRLGELCCRAEPASDGRGERTRLTVKCKTRCVSDENLLDSGGLPGLQRTSPSPQSGSEPDMLSPATVGLAAAARGLSASEAHLDRVQPPGQRIHRPDLAASQQSLSEAGSSPDVSKSRTFVSRRLPTETMRHAQTIADISKCTLRDLKSRNRSDGGRDFARASRLGFERAQYESAGSLTADAAPAASAPTAVDDSQLVDDVYGSVTLTVSFNPHMKRLLLQLETVHDLPARGDDRAYDVATEVTLLPDAKLVKRAPVAAASLSPRYDVEWALPLRAKQLAGGTLRVTVLDAARRGAHEAVGHALLPLHNTVGETPERYVLPLSRRSTPSAPLGRLLVSLSYRPADDRLSVVVVRARALRLSSAVHRLPAKTFEKHASYDTFVKASLRCAGQKVKTKRSPVVAGSREPYYNAVFGFVLPQGLLDDACVVVSVVMRGPMRTDLLVGRVVIGPFFAQSGGRPTQWGRAVTSSEVATQWNRLHL